MNENEVLLFNLCLLLFFLELLENDVEFFVILRIIRPKIADIGFKIKSAKVEIGFHLNHASNRRP